MAGPATALKAMRAVLNLPKEKFTLQCQEYDRPFGTRDNFMRDGDGYQSYSVPLGMGTWHMVLVSKRDGFLPSISEEAVWKEISSSAHNTPLLRSWSPAIYERLLGLPKLLQRAECWGCECGLMNLTDTRLDQIVTELVQRKKLQLC